MEKMKTSVKLATSIALVTFLLSLCAFGDTVIMKDGKRTKGLILDEFTDRIVVSTVEGEKTLMVSDIRSAVYSTEEKALMQKARNHQRRREYIEAYYTYEKVLELDPDSKEARERINYLESYIETATRESMRDKMTLGKAPLDEKEEEPREVVVARDLGIVLAPGEKYVQVEKVTTAEASTLLEPGDRIVAVWSEMTAYMDEGDVLNLLLVPGEMRLVIERTTYPVLSHAKSWGYRILFSSYKEVIGASLKLYKRGVIIRGVSLRGPFGEFGIEEGDLLYRIGSKNTRYMHISRIVDFIMANQGRRIEVVIRRDVTLWRKGQDK